jgi:aryl-alcohol dehydrogenase-like predicted oxidoreductase
VEHRNLGSAGIGVSRLCLGAMMFGKWGNADHADCVRIIHRAIDAGIDFIDTSNNYSEGESETIVGKAIADRRERVVLATKVWAPMGPGPNDRGLSRKAILAQIDHSLRRLGTDYLDLYQIHRPDPSTPWEETLGALTDLVRQGKVRYLGCSTNHYAGEGPWEKKLEAWEIVETLWISERRRLERFVSLQPPYSILRRAMEAEHFPMTRRFGIANIVWSPLEGGWLTGKYRRGAANPSDSPRSATWVGDLAKPRFARRLEVVERLVGLAAERGMPLAELALAWALGNDDVTSVIIGPRTAAQLESCLRAAERTLDPADRARIDAWVPPGTTVL